MLNKTIWFVFVLNIGLSYVYAMEAVKNPNTDQKVNNPEERRNSESSLPKSHGIVNFEKMLQCTSIVESRFQTLNNDINLDLGKALEGIRLIEQEMIKVKKNVYERVRNLFLTRNEQEEFNPTSLNNMMNIIDEPNSVLIYGVSNTAENKTEYEKIFTLMELIKKTIDTGLDSLKNNELTGELYYINSITIAQKSAELIMGIIKLVDGKIFHLGVKSELGTMLKHIEMLASMSKTFQNICTLLDEYKTIDTIRPNHCTDAQALEFYRNRKSEQSKQELSRKFVDKWKHFVELRKDVTQ